MADTFCILPFLVPLTWLAGIACSAEADHRGEGIADAAHDDAASSTSGGSSTAGGTSGGGTGGAGNSGATAGAANTGGSAGTPNTGGSAGIGGSTSALDASIGGNGGNVSAHLDGGEEAGLASDASSGDATAVDAASGDAACPGSTTLEPVAPDLLIVMATAARPATISPIPRSSSARHSIRSWTPRA